MRHLKHKDIEYDFPLQEGEMIDLTIENRDFYRRFALDLLGDDTDKLTFSEDGIPLSLSKHAIIVTDLFELDPNSRKVLAAVYKKIAVASVTPERRIKLEAINKLIESFLDDIASDFDGTVIYNDEVAIPQLLEDMNFKFDYDDSTFLTSFISYVKAWREAIDLRLVVTFNLFSLLDPDKTSFLQKELLYLGLSLLNISYVAQKNPGIKSVIVDKDLCEIF